MQSDAANTGRPAKRIKTGHTPSRTALRTIGIQSSPHDRLHANNLRVRRGPHVALVPESDGMNVHTDTVEFAPKTSVQRPILSRYNRYKERSNEKRKRKKPYLTELATSFTEPFDIDLSYAPSEPVELALWVARWIENVSSHPTGLAPEAMWTKAQRHRCPRKPDIVPSEKAKADSDHRVLRSQTQIGEGKAQLCKQKWKRQGLETRTHGVNRTITSIVGLPTDIERDLEYHPSSKAGTVSSKTSSEGSCTWSQHRFKEQKAKCRRLERRCASPLESGSPISPYRNDSSQGGDHPVNVAKKFLLHTLRPIINNEIEPSSKTTAVAQDTAYANTDFDSKSLVLAMRALIEDSSIMAAIHMSLNHYNASSSSDSDAGFASMRSDARAQIDESSSGSAGASSPETGASPASVQLRLRGGMIMENRTFLQFDQSKSKKIVEAYNAAHKIFEDTARSSSPTYITPYGDPQDNYVTPYGPPEAGSASLNNTNGHNTLSGVKTPPRIATHRESEEVQRPAAVINEEPVHKDGQDDEIDHAQVDRLLLLAGGGSLTDDDTDDEIEVLATFTKAEPDQDILKVLNHVYGTVAGRGSNGTYLISAHEALVYAWLIKLIWV